MLLGIVAMTFLTIFSAVSTWYGVENKVFVPPITFGDLFRLGHGVNILVVLAFSLKHLVHALK